MEELYALAEQMRSSPKKRIALAKELLRIRDRNGRYRPLVANAAQIAFEHRSGRNNIVLKARQMGMTTWVAGRFFLNTVCQPGTTTLLVAHTREASESMFAIVRRMWEGLPEELTEGVLRLRSCNAGQIVFAETGSEFRVSSAGDPHAGRGLSVQNLHCSEVSRWPGDAVGTLAGLRAALAPDGEMVLESTPSGAYGAFYDEWSAAVDGGSEAQDEQQRTGAPLAGLQEAGLQEAGLQAMVRHFFPWWMEAAYVGTEVSPEAMTAEEWLLVQRHGLHGAQIGFRRGLERSYGRLRSQEFAEDAESCFRTSGACCFDLDRLERRLREVPEPVGRERNGALLEWLGARPGRRYVLGVDTAGGGDEGDFAAVQVVDVETGMQCLELQERLRPRELAAVCAQLAHRYGGALVAVERNNHGAAVLALLELSAEVKLYRQGGEAGWLTSATSKPEIVARLGTLLQETPERFFSRRLLGECRTFVEDERGRAAAAGRAHDDLVMAMAIAQAVRAETMAHAG